MARIVIVRSNEHINRFWGIDLYLNGEKLGDICNDETMEFEIPEGNHSLVAKIDWCGSPELNFEVGKNDIQTFNVSGFKHNKMVLPAAATLVVLHYMLTHFFDTQLSVFFVLPLLLLLIFYVSIGRNQYLTLEPQVAENLSAERIK